METLFISLQKRIAESFAELTLVDEDYGQLQPMEEIYPVTFPCVLIDVQQVTWTDGLKGLQLGNASVKVKLAMDCYDDSHYKSGTAEKAYDRLMFAKKLHKKVHLFGGKIIDDEDGNLLDVHFSPLTRISSSDYSLPGGIKVYETIYSTGIKDMDAIPVLQKVARPSITIDVTI
jgi:hypothetical protein